MTLIAVVAKVDAFFVVVLGYLINGERIVPIEVLGMFVVFSTVFVISQNQPEEEIMENN